MRKNFLPEGYRIPVSMFKTNDGSRANLRAHILSLYPSLEWLLVKDDDVQRNWDNVTVVTEVSIQSRFLSVIKENQRRMVMTKLVQQGFLEWFYNAHLSSLMKDKPQPTIIEGLTKTCGFNWEIERNAAVYRISYLLYIMAVIEKATPSWGGDSPSDGCDTPSLFPNGQVFTPVF
jgi:hypothetical protein